MLCTRLFLKPLIAGLLGLPTEDRMLQARLETPLPANDHRQDYLRATLSRHPDGTMTVAPFPQQDSAMQHTLHAAQALIRSKASTDPAQQAEYIAMAAGWQALAVEAERSSVAPLPGEIVSQDRDEATSDDLP